MVDLVCILILAAIGAASSPCTEAQMAKLQIKASRLAVTNAATGANVKTTDGAVHKFRRAFIQPVLPTNDEKGFVAAVREYLADATQANAGEKVDLVLADGKVAAKDLQPTDAVPTKAEKTSVEIKDKEGKVIGTEDTVDHGQNITASHPATYEALMECLVIGIKTRITRDSSQVANETFRVGGAARGRKAAELDTEDFA